MVKKNSKFLFGIIFSVLFLLSISSVSAVVTLTTNNITIVTPAASGTLSGTAAVFNVSIDQLAGYQAENWTRVRVYLQSVSLTQNTTESLVTDWFKNSTSSGFDLNGTINTFQVQDGNDYIFKAEIWNGTNYFNKSQAGIIIDNTVPAAPTSLLPTSSSTGSINFSASVISANTTTCYLNFSGINPGISSYTMSYGHGGVCSYSLNNVPEQTYMFYVTASDGTQSTTSAIQTLNIDIPTSSGTAVYIQQKEGTSFNKPTNTLSIAGAGSESQNIFQIIWDFIKSLFQ